MANKSTPVWVYRPEETAPVEAGLFSWHDDTRVGEFVYHADYLADARSRPLDPMSLRFRRSVIKETRQDGIFGIFRDAGPDAWGRDQLYRLHGDLDEFDLLLKGPGDGVGNLVLGEPLRALQAYTLTDLDEVSRGFPPEDAALANAIHPTTSMGGAKPKLLVDDQDAYWIAKFPEKGDPRRFLAANEHVMLEMARDCGIDAAVSRLHTLPDERQILLVRRFDLEKRAGGIARKGFASAYTVLGMGDPRTDGQRKSYLRLADEVQRWTGKRAHPDIWRRVVFNALVGNIDDHPRNHALIIDSSGWRLSPAFDIVASARPAQVALAMRFHPGGAVATPESLLASAEAFGIDPAEAIQRMKSIAETILSTWRPRFEALGTDREPLEKLESAFTLAKQVMDREFELPDPKPGARPRRYRR